MEGIRHPGDRSDVRVRDAAPADAPTPEPRREPEPALSREELLRAARQRRPETPASVPSVPPVENPTLRFGKKAAFIGGAGVLGVFGATIGASLAAMWGVHKVMNRVGDFFAGPIVKSIPNLGKLNPFKWAWNKIVGGGGASHGHASDHPGHGHSGGHAPAPHH